MKHMATGMEPKCLSSRQLLIELSFLLFQGLFWSKTISDAKQHLYTRKRATDISFYIPLGLLSPGHRAEGTWELKKGGQEPQPATGAWGALRLNGVSSGRGRGHTQLNLQTLIIQLLLSFFLFVSLGRGIHLYKSNNKSSPYQALTMQRSVRDFKKSKLRGGRNSWVGVRFCLFSWLNMSLKTHLSALPNTTSVPT